MSIATGSSIATSGLIFALDAANKKSYPGSGTSWTDISGNGIVGTLTNSPTYSTTNGGNFAFNGSNTYVTTPGVTLNFSGGASMEIVFNSVDIQSRAQGYMSFYSGSTYIDFYSPGNSTLRWETWITAGSVGGAFFSPATLTNNTWYHAIGTYYNGVSILYINGVSVNSSTYAAANYSASFNSNIIVGQYGGYLSGSMPVAKLYNRALSANEVNQNFAAIRGRFGI